LGFGTFFKLAKEAFAAASQNSTIIVSALIVAFSPLLALLPAAALAFGAAAFGRAFPAAISLQAANEAGNARRGNTKASENKDTVLFEKLIEETFLGLEQDVLAEQDVAE